jgi:hypothetical protein
MSWDQYHDYAQVTQLGRDLVKAYPIWLKWSLLVNPMRKRSLVLSDFDSDKVENKPGFIYDGGIHANEMQGVEVAIRHGI